ncbi:MAG: Dam family site-specific DNA-(adenine-N6)-methyltransferase [Bacteroidales bacterium]|jgi:DNA adenine methylase|nr:Dam family site-specific DNA-(adenine-N6)-methyltransferase [Bacteroidales bacterium]MDY0334164.1 Dam family site-specific DNA-(adenine-N6)-methyltransferase [Bacteroidales bacterium]NCU36628.1 Dam family site-specific DNA-(adenine-N6)-methyltransferase [Candidatus Falkowbacteria bacterium]
MKIITPPIKSQGIKTKLVPWISQILPNKNGKWIEPFLGTGVVAFNMGFKNALLNDTNPHIIKLYQEIQNGIITPQIVKFYLEKEGEILRNAGDNGYDHFRFIKNRFNKNPNSLDFIFLSRAGFNGMMRFNKKGEWNIPFCKKPERFAQPYITKIVNQVAKVSHAIQPEWEFTNKQFSEIIPLANKEDIFYCDPPYYGRYVDYYNGWTEEDEELLFNQLRDTEAKFILSTWHHNDYRENEMISKFWNRFNIITRDHFYHSGGKIENRKSIVEALICNFDLDEKIAQHNHGIKEKPKQLSLFELVNENATNVDN